MIFGKGVMVFLLKWFIFDLDCVIIVLCFLFMLFEDLLWLFCFILICCFLVLMLFLSSIVLMFLLSSVIIWLMVNCDIGMVCWCWYVVWYFLLRLMVSVRWFLVVFCCLMLMLCLLCLMLWCGFMIMVRVCGWICGWLSVFSMLNVFWCGCVSNVRWWLSCWCGKLVRILRILRKSLIVFVIILLILLKCWRNLIVVLVVLNWNRVFLVRFVGFCWVWCCVWGCIIICWMKFLLFWFWCWLWVIWWCLSWLSLVCCWFVCCWKFFVIVFC